MVDGSGDIRQLAADILKHKILYYSGKPEISDVEFDRLEDRLRQINPDHPVLSFVGDAVGTSGKKVNHERPMLSLNKTYKVEELFTWMDSHTLVGTHKVDGVSLSVVFKDGKLNVAKTRGNGRFGEDVTEKVRWVPDVPVQLQSVQGVEVRGELFCDEKQFVDLCHAMEKRDLELPSSPRNIVAGVLGRKTDIDLAAYFRFMAFDVLADNDDMNLKDEEGKFLWLEKSGFKIPNYQLLKSEKEVRKYLESVLEFMEHGDYGIDGAVFSYNDLQKHDELGNTSHHPRYKMSFKWQGQTAQAKIVDIKWATSRHGIVTPVAVIDPVELSGASITNITLHNAAMVESYNLKIGDSIEIVRSGEVIPKFLRVVKASQGKFKWPKKCPACEGQLSNDEVRLICTNHEKCPAQQIGQILNWIKSASIDDLSEKRLESMIELGFVSSIPDLYRLEMEQMLELPLTKEKMATKLLNNISSSKTLQLASFLQGLGISGGGMNTWEKILEHHPSLDKVRKVSQEQLVDIDGFAEKSATAIVSGLLEKSSLIEELLAVGVNPKAFETVGGGGGNQKLEGKVFVITGSLSRPRAQIEKVIKAAGGKTSSSVSKNTTAVITNDTESTSSKMKKAAALSVPIWSEKDLEESL